MRDALEAYRRGDVAEAARLTAAPLARDAEARLADDRRIVRGLALFDLGAFELAEREFAAVLDQREPSPYAPLALWAIVEAHHQRGRLDRVAAAVARWFDAPWHGRDPRSLRVRRYFEASGEIRSPTTRGRERELEASSRKWLAALANRSDRVVDRTLYLGGLDLFRLGRFLASYETLERIGLERAYRLYALHTSAQALFALGRGREAREGGTNTPRGSSDPTGGTAPRRAKPATPRAHVPRRRAPRGSTGRRRRPLPSRPSRRRGRGVAEPELARRRRAEPRRRRGGALRPAPFVRDRRRTGPQPRGRLRPSREVARRRVRSLERLETELHLALGRAVEAGRRSLAPENRLTDSSDPD